MLPTGVVVMLQETWLYSFGGSKDTSALRTLLIEYPLVHKEREGWFNALSHVPSVQPGPAHAIACHFASLGALIADCTNPHT